MLLLSLPLCLNLTLCGVASVVSQPHAAPQAVDAYHNTENYAAALQVYHTATVHHAAPYHAATVVHHVAPYPPAPVVHAAPPAPYHAPAPYQASASYHEEKETPEPHSYTNGVSDDYSKAAFNAAETADANGAVVGSYSVALPDGRTQHVKYTADHYHGYVADVSYQGVPVYPEVKAYAPAPHAPCTLPCLSLIISRIFIKIFISSISHKN